jgi:hypothetical protein
MSVGKSRSRAGTNTSRTLDGQPLTRTIAPLFGGLGNNRGPTFDVVEVGAPTLVPSPHRKGDVSTRSPFVDRGHAAAEHAARDRVALEPLDRNQRRSNRLRWINTRKALDTMLLCWIGVLVAVLTVLTVLAFR